MPLNEGDQFRSPDDNRINASDINFNFAPRIPRADILDFLRRVNKRIQEEIGENGQTENNQT